MDLSGYRKYIEDALEYAGGTHTYDDVIEAVRSGAMQAWPGPSAIIITELQDYPQKRAINFFLAGGEKSSLAEMAVIEPLILEWAKKQGCTVATFAGRPGWERTFLTTRGWESKLVVLEKALDGEEGR